MSYGQPYGSRDGQTRAYPMPGQAPSERDYRQPQGGYRQPPPPPQQTDYDQGQPPRPPRKKRRVGRILLIILLVIVLLIAAVWLYLEFSINRVKALEDYSGRPAAGAGTNWLLVGSDSRAGLDAENQERLNTGDVKGQRTDTMLLLHLPDNSEKPTLLSLPRDSEVAIPGKGKNRLNAAYAFGGPQLLVQTIEKNTNLRIDHYLEIGFGGFAGIVDSVGGVEICVDKPMKDPEAGIDLAAGCQELDGANALGYVRSRKTAATPRSDLDRVVHQRQFMAALMDKVVSPGTILNPFRMVPLLGDAPDALTMDEGDHLHNLPSLASAIAGASSGSTVSTTVPLGKVANTVTWDPAKSKQLFDALRTDAAIPSSLIVSP